MLKLMDNIAGAPERWLGDPRPLVEQIGSPGGIATLDEMSAALQARPVNSLPALRRFLHSYQARVLVPVELPAVHRAFEFANHNQLRELIAFDQELAREPLLQQFAAASQQVGRTQLRRFKPMRDHRFGQRYLQAVEQRRAHGWHTLVYGITLAVFALPLRQGLLNYALQTTGGFVDSAARSLQLSGEDCRALVEELSTTLPQATAALLKAPRLA